MTRNCWIDFARWIFAFLVVVIHVPCLGKPLLMPLARCAVPFFLMVTGYYLYNSKDSESSRKFRFRRAAKKWVKLWFTYSIVQYVILLAINIHLGNSVSWTMDDIAWFAYNGNCRATDVVFYNSEGFGTSTLWFLYCGASSLLLISVTPPRKYLTIIVLLTFTVSLGVNYIEGERITPRLLFLALPSIYCGYHLHYLRERVVRIFDIKRNVFIVVSLFILMYAEAFILWTLHIRSEVFFMTLPFMFFFLLLLTRLENRAVVEKALTKLPSTITLDIYLWHRFVYLFIVMIGFTIKPLYAIVCYIIVFAMSYGWRCGIKAHGFKL